MNLEVSNLHSVITEIQIVPIKANEGLVAFVSFLYDRSFYFGAIGIYTRPHGGYRLTYPTRKTGISNLPIYHPINKDIADIIEKAVIDKYKEIIGEE